VARVFAVYSCHGYFPDQVKTTMTGLEWFIAALLAAAVVGIAAALIHSRIWPVDTGTHDFHRPLERRSNRDAEERR
jgi:hypothetical protein